MENLPLEILMEISMSLDLLDIYYVAQICKPFDRLLNSQFLWKNLFERDFFSLSRKRLSYLEENNVTWKRLYREFYCGENIEYDHCDLNFNNNEHVEMNYRTQQYLRNVVETKRNEIIVSLSNELFLLDEDYYLQKSIKHEYRESNHMFEFPILRKLAMVFIDKELLVTILDLDKFEIETFISLPKDIDSKVGKMTHGMIPQNINFTKTKDNKLICVFGGKGRHEMVCCEWDLFGSPTPSVKILFSFISNSYFCNCDFISEDFILCNDNFVDLRERKIVKNSVFPEYFKSTDFSKVLKNYIVCGTKGVFTVYRYIDKIRKYEKVQFIDKRISQDLLMVFYPVTDTCYNQIEPERLCLIESVGRFDEFSDERDVVMKYHVDYTRFKLYAMKWNNVRNRRPSYGCAIGKTHMANKFEKREEEVLGDDEKKKTGENNYTRNGFKYYLEIQSLNGRTFQQIELPKSNSGVFFSKLNNRIIVKGYFNRKDKKQRFLNVIDWKLKNV